MRTRTKFVLSILASTLATTSCSYSTSEEGLRPRTAEENLAIQNSWYPIQSMECQLLVDSFNLARAAIGSGETADILENQELINSRLELTARLTSQKILELATTTNEPSIRDYALEAAPVFAQLGTMIIDSESSLEEQFKFLEDFSEITGKVPDACKS